MHIITRRRLRDFARIHPDAGTPLDVWYKLMEASSFASAAEVVAAFPYVSLLGDDRACFNIGGNKYRLIVQFRFRARKVYVLHVVTHAEYNRLEL